MNKNFLSDMEIIYGGDRPLSLAMSPEWPYGEAERLAYDKFMYVRKNKPDFNADDYANIILEYKNATS